MKETAEKQQMQLLFIGVDDAIVDFVRAARNTAAVKRIQTTEEFLKFVENPDTPPSLMVIAGPGLKEMSTIEVAQSFRAIAPNGPLYYCHSSRDAGFDRRSFIKNGFNDAFLIPLDNDSLLAVLEEFATKVAEMPAYRPVRIIDIEADMKLSFDLHILLPRNQKYVQYSSAGRTIEPSRLEKLRNHNVGAMFVPLDQMAQFYDYTAEKLKALNGNSGGMSETEKRTRLQGAVRELMTDIFATSGQSNFDTGKKMLNDAGEIVKSYIQKGDDEGIYGKILKVVGDVSGSYSHLSNVSTYGALFAMATGIGEPEELALAGLFHDLGLSVVPQEIQAKSPDTWTEEERNIFDKHPEHSINLVKEKKIVLPQNVQAMILQHHERIDGGGPLQVREPKLRKDSQLLAIADMFDELTQIKIGLPKHTPEGAIQIIQDKNFFNPTIVEKLISLFPPATKKSA